MKIAVIETGGKQYLVSENKTLKVEKLNSAQEAAEFVFDKVLLMADDKGVKVGAPYVDGAKVKAQVLKNGKSKKIIVFHYHNKTRFRKKAGHRQQFTQLQIKSM